MEIDSNKRAELLLKIWEPDHTFKFPITGKQKLKFQLNWLRKWSWLTYSKLLDGAFCKFCVLFKRNEGGRGNQKLGKLVLEKFSNWKKAIEEFNKHEGLALRGHNDSGPISLQNSQIYNESNFRELLRFKIEAGDKNLANHLETAPRNATYLSPEIQNEIINTCSSMIIEQLVSRINSAKCFTVVRNTDNKNTIRPLFVDISI
ncbi:uncharacterized protein LOC126551069 [Aphis gossypii]|uniref:uncharacterized protein LOC126551069 n=1 Tax=Aphis gossypii TaxID=80765 RepID=UPI0021599CDD|nr:uncharacterized protein LOC126551069 [Aphis gossypii]